MYERLEPMDPRFHRELDSMPEQYRPVFYAFMATIRNRCRPTRLTEFPSPSPLSVDLDALYLNIRRAIAKKG